MKLFKAYVKSKPINYGKLINQLELKLIEINKDVDGSYMLLNSLNGAKAKDLQKFKGIKKVYTFDQNTKENYFKLFVSDRKSVV